MSTTEIISVRGRRVWDSRGRPTVEAEVTLTGGALGRAIAPAGASTGSGEAVDLRDGGSRFGGADVMMAVGNVNGEIARTLRGCDARDQKSIDEVLIALDGTPNKARLGANALVATSTAVLHAAAAAAGVPLYAYLLGDRPAIMPIPEVQIFGGGAHAGRRVDIQDFMIVTPKARSFAEALEWTAEIYRAAGAIMSKTGHLQGVADEGGFWPAFESNEAALDALVSAIERAGFTPGDDVSISLDIASSELYRDGAYRLALEGLVLDSDAMSAMLIDWLDRYPIISIEDPLAEHDTAGFRSPGPNRGRRFPCDRRSSSAPRGIDAGLQRDSREAEPSRDRERGHGCGRSRARCPLGRDRLRALGRDRGRYDRPPCGRLGPASAQGWFVFALGAHGKVE
jgi:enolase